VATAIATDVRTTPGSNAIVAAASGSPAPDTPLRWLAPHPGQPGPAGFSVRAAAAWTGPGRLQLRYDVRGPAGALLWPPAAVVPARRDGLWQHTCCEVFIQTGGSSYIEVNLAPAGHWAAYAFSGYRMRAVQEPAWRAPQVDAAGTAGEGGDWHWLLQATLELPVVIAPQAPMGLCAVLESARDGTLSYWALAHPRAQPDFHDAAGHLPTKDLGSIT